MQLSNRTFVLYSGAMPKVTDEHRAAQRQRILDAAFAVTRDKGLSELTMGDIIQESGLSAGAIYGYYKGKEQIIADLAGQVLDTRRQALDSLLAREDVPPPAEALALMVGNLPADWLEDGLLLQFWGQVSTHDDIRSSAAQMLGGLRDNLASYLAAWFAQQGVRDDVAAERGRHLAPALVALVQGYVLQGTLQHGGSSRDDYLASATSLIEGCLAS